MPSFNARTSIISSNKFYLAGWYGELGLRSSDFYVKVYNLDGVLDTSFSEDGIQSLGIGNYWTSATVLVDGSYQNIAHAGEDSDSQLYSIQVQNDGKIILSGTSCNTFDYIYGTSTYYASIVRLNSDGSLDHSYGVDGISLNTNQQYIVDSMLQDDGKLITVGYGTIDWSHISEGNGIDPYVAVDSGLVRRYNTDGSVDEVFSSNNPLGDAFSEDWLSFPFSRVILNSVDLQSDDKLIVAGIKWDGSTSNNYSGYRVLRLNQDGSLDETYGENGVVSLDTTVNSISWVPEEPAGDFSSTSTVLILPDDSLILGGRALNETSDFFITHLDINGNIDLTFGLNGNGVVEADFGGKWDSVTDLSYNPFNSKIIVSGNSNGSLILQQYNLDGSIDYSFNQNVTIPSFFDSGTTDGWELRNFNVEISQDKIIVSGGREIYQVASFNFDGTLYKTWMSGTESSDEISGTDVTDIFRGDLGDDVLEGGASNDVLEGGAGNDVLNGGDDLDTADYSFALNAVNIDLSKGNAKGINAAGMTETGTDTLLSIENATGGAGNDVLVGSASANVLYGGDGDDVVSAGQGNDLIIGGDGAGNDTYDGGDGIDTVKYTSAIAGITVNLNLKSANAISTSADSGIGVDKLTKIENIIAGNYNDIIIGNSSNNSILGKDGADTINGNNGNDSISGGSGNDALTGGTGNDTFIIDGGTDTITDLGNGQDILQVTSGILNATVTKAWVATNSSYNNAEVNLTSNGQSINLSAVNTGTNGFSLINTGKAATLIGSAFDDSFVGGTGADTLNGRAGFNTLNGGSGNDTYVIDITGATSSNIMFNEVYDSQGVDRLNFTVTSNEFAVIQDSWFSIRRLNDGKDLAIGVFDDNHEEPINGVIIKDQFNYAGGSFNNTINTITLKAPATENKSITFNIAVTGSGSSHLIGTKGVDYIAGFGGNQTLSGGAGNDILSASRFDTAGNTGDTLYGEAGNDDISGKEGNDILDGGVGSDIIEGGDGDDIIYGKEGNDVLTGGDGADTFKFDTALKSNLDRITDFEHLADQIQLSLSIFTNIKGADNVFDSTDLLSGSWTGKQKVNATSSNEHLIFNTANNGLYYDADGSAKGAAVQFATLIGVSSVTLDDFTII
jgi:uncharacterized delta-60 repeat protein